MDSFSALLATLRKEGATLDQALVKLRAAGATPAQCIEAIRAEEGVSLQGARTLFFRSPALAKDPKAFGGLTEKMIAALIAQGEPTPVAQGESNATTQEAKLETKPPMTKAYAEELAAQMLARPQIEKKPASPFFRRSMKSQFTYFAVMLIFMGALYFQLNIYVVAAVCGVLFAAWKFLLPRMRGALAASGKLSSAESASAPSEYERVLAEYRARGVPPVGTTGFDAKPAIPAPKAEPQFMPIPQGNPSGGVEYEEPLMPGTTRHRARQQSAASFTRQLKERALYTSDLHDLEGQDCVLIEKNVGVVARVLSFWNEGDRMGVTLQREPGAGFAINHLRLRGASFVAAWNGDAPYSGNHAYQDPEHPGEQIRLDTKIEYVERRAHDFVYFHFDEPMAVRLFFLPEYVRKARAKDDTGWDQIESAAITAGASLAKRPGPNILRKFDLIDNPPYLGASADLLRELKGQTLLNISRPFSAADIELYQQNRSAVRTDQYFALGPNPVYIQLENCVNLAIFENRETKGLYAWRETCPITFIDAPNSLQDTWGTELIDCKSFEYSKRFWSDFAGRRIERVAVVLVKNEEGSPFHSEAGLLIVTGRGSEFLIASSRLCLATRNFHLGTRTDISPEFAGKITYIDV